MAVPSGFVHPPFSARLIRFFSMCPTVPRLSSVKSPFLPRPMPRSRRSHTDSLGKKLFPLLGRHIEVLALTECLDNDFHFHCLYLTHHPPFDWSLPFRTDSSVVEGLQRDHMLVLPYSFLDRLLNLLDPQDGIMSIQALPLGLRLSIPHCATFSRGPDFT